ncbi:MAG: 5-(carboxyamino)imidazole ribonucleotide synthase [Oscillospiraceae bacterium]|nr:5-(carboxyamino)imidazole ribonucleotide synthase [Oscillospiraceae bacterium]
MGILKRRVAIIGGGQLGKMMILEAKRLGIYCAVLDPDTECAARSVADEYVNARFDDVSAVMALAARADVVTFELEHVGRDCLLALEKSGLDVRPSPASLLLIQNKFVQKTKLKEAQIPVPEFISIAAAPDCALGKNGDLARAGELLNYPYMLKACCGGYDGKGNAPVLSGENAEGAYSALGGGKIELMAEGFVRFEKEISVLACRSVDGDTVVYPIAQNQHEDSILKETRAPACVTEETARKAREIAARVMDVFGAVGMFCVEMFVTREGDVLVNEIAPRPHNSGHYTIDSCFVNQFEQHIRAVVGLPLAEPMMFGAAVMRNLLGEGDGIAEVYGAKEALAIDGVKLHIYGKPEVRARRKMGHLTACADTIEEALAKADKACGVVKIGV